VDSSPIESLPHQQFAFADRESGTSVCIKKRIRSYVAKGSFKSAIGDYKSLMRTAQQKGLMQEKQCRVP
jgi:hypothetical protein